MSVTQLVAKIFAQTDYVLKVLGLPDGEIRLKKTNDFLVSLANKSYNKNVSEFLHFISSVSNEQVEVESASQINAIRVMTISSHIDITPSSAASQNDTPDNEPHAKPIIAVATMPKTSTTKTFTPAIAHTKTRIYGIALYHSAAFAIVTPSPPPDNPKKR